jgi:hypothetical protein
MTKLISFDFLQKLLYKNTNDIFLKKFIQNGFLIHNFQNGDINCLNGIPIHKKLFKNIYSNLLNSNNFNIVHQDDKNNFNKLLNLQYFNISGEYSTGVSSKKRAFVTGIINKHKAMLLNYGIQAHTDKFINCSNFDNISKDYNNNNNNNLNYINVCMDTNEYAYFEFFEDSDIPISKKIYLGNISKDNLSFILKNMINNSNSNSKDDYDTNLLSLDNKSDYMFITIIDLNYGRKFNMSDGLFTELDSIFSKYL